MTNLKKYTLLFALLASGASHTVMAQSPAAIANVNAYCKGLIANHEINGNILVAQDGKVLYQHASGYANFEQHTLNTNATGFNTASIGKTFTAVAVLQLVEQHKISLDDTYNNYFPDFPYPEVTIRQLLSHTSGTSDQELAPVVGVYEKKHPELIITNKDLIPALAEAKVKLKLAPGEKWWYSNIGFQLLALLVEKQSGEDFGKYLDEHIFKPAGMRHTYLRTRSVRPLPGEPYADNYDYPAIFDTLRVKFDGPRSYYAGNDVAGNGNVISTTGDFFHYDQALAGGTVLHVATLNEAYTPAKLKNGAVDSVWLDIGNMGQADNGLGWFIFRDKSMGKIVWHTGGMPGCTAIFMRNVTKNQMVVMFDNTNSEKLYPKALNALRLLNGKTSLIVPRSLTKIYAKALFAKGEAYANPLLLRLKSDTLHYALNENDMNNLGYAFLEQKHVSEALATFKLNTVLYPGSDNVYNSYGDGLLKSGDKAAAIAMYRKSLVINPKNEDSINALKAINEQPQCKP